MVYKMKFFQAFWKKISAVQRTKQHQTKIKSNYLPRSGEIEGSGWSLCWETWPQAEEEEEYL